MGDAWPLCFEPFPLSRRLLIDLLPIHRALVNSDCIFEGELTHSAAGRGLP